MKRRRRGAVHALSIFLGQVCRSAPYSDDFKWEPENGAIVVAEQRALAVYRNDWGQVVIRAAATEYGEPDAFIVVSQEHLPALIAKLSAILKEVE